MTGRSAQKSRFRFCFLGNAIIHFDWSHGGRCRSLLRHCNLFRSFPPGGNGHILSPGLFNDQYRPQALKNLCLKWRVLFLCGEDARKIRRDIHGITVHSLWNPGGSKYFAFLLRLSVIHSRPVFPGSGNCTSAVLAGVLSDGCSVRFQGG